MAEKAITKRCRRNRPSSCGTVAGVWPALASFADVPQSVFGPSGPPRLDEIAGRLRCSPRSARRTMARPIDRSRVLADSRHRPRWGNVLRICVTEAAVPAQCSHALLNGCEATILAAEAGVICAPRIILRLRPRADLSCYSDNCQHEKQNSHG